MERSSIYSSWWRPFRSATTGARALALTGLFAFLLCGGCGANYATPGSGADLRAFAHRDALTDATVGQALERKPLATLPCAIAAVRIQAAGYRSDTAETYGEGNYCIVTTRDIESDTDMQKIRKLPMVLGVAPLNGLLLPQHLNSDLELRQGAAALHADMLLVYTLNTTYRTEDHLSPLTLVTLGLSPNITAQVVTTASAMLIDTRNGYVYGYAESTEHGLQLTNAWMTDQAVSDARRGTESRAFSKMVDSLTLTWDGVVKNLSGAARHGRNEAISLAIVVVHSTPPFGQIGFQ